MGSKSQENSWLIVVSGFVFFVAMIFVWGRTFPILLSDEISHLRPVAWLYGLDWKSVDSLMPWAAPVYGFLVSPFFHPAFSDEYAYQGVLIFNSTILAVTFLVAYRTLTFAFSDFPFSTRLFAAACAVIYPASLVNTRFLWAEPIVLLFVWVVSYALASFAKDATAKGSTGRRRVFRSSIIIFTLISFISPLIHVRAFAISCALSFLFLVARYFDISFYSKLKRAFLCFLFGLFGLFLNSKLSALFSASEPAGLQHAPLKTVDKIFSFSAHDLSFVLEMASGQLAYLVTSMVAIVLIGVLPAIPFARNLIRPNGSEDGSAEVICIFSLLMTSACLFFSAISLSSPERLDHYFYGRYIEPFSSPLFSVGIVLLANGCKKIAKVSSLIIAISVAFCCFLLHLLWPDFPENNLSLLMLSGWSYVLFFSGGVDADKISEALVFVSLVLIFLINYGKAFLKIFILLFFLSQRLFIEDLYVAPRESQYGKYINELRHFQESQINFEKIAISKSEAWRVPLAVQLGIRKTPVSYIDFSSESFDLGKNCVVLLPVSSGFFYENWFKCRSSNGFFMQFSAGCSAAQKSPYSNFPLNICSDLNLENGDSDERHDGEEQVKRWAALQ